MTHEGDEGFRHRHLAHVDAEQEKRKGIPPGKRLSVSPAGPHTQKSIPRWAVGVHVAGETVVLLEAITRGRLQCWAPESATTRTKSPPRGSMRREGGPRAANQADRREDRGVWGCACVQGP